MKFNFLRKRPEIPNAFPTLPLSARNRTAQIGAPLILPGVPWHPPDCWRALDQFQPSIIAGPQQELRRYCQHVRAWKLDTSYLDTAVYCLTSLGERPLTDALRDELWDLFGVPVFEIFVAGDGQVLARECDAHEGWHVNTQAAEFMRLTGDPHLVIARKSADQRHFDAMGAGFGGDVTTELCACGLQTPRVINLPTEEPWEEEEEELLYATY